MRLFAAAMGRANGMWKTKSAAGLVCPSVRYLTPEGEGFGSSNDPLRKSLCVTRKESLGWWTTQGFVRYAAAFSAFSFCIT